MGRQLLTGNVPLISLWSTAKHSSCPSNTTYKPTQLLFINNNMQANDGGQCQTWLDKHAEGHRRHCSHVIGMVSHFVLCTESFREEIHLIQPLHDRMAAVEPQRAVVPSSQQANLKARLARSSGYLGGGITFIKYKQWLQKHASLLVLLYVHDSGSLTLQDLHSCDRCLGPL